jgi:hypothetical protein
MKLVSGRFLNRKGSYGEVFFPEMNDSKYVVKVFLVNGRPERRSAVRRVFENEVAAYEIARREPDLRELTPDFMGKVTVEGIVDVYGQDISHEFHLDLAYQMERVTGEECKLNSFYPEDERKLIKDLFHRHGIAYTEDCSILTNNRKHKIVDFSILKPPEPRW